MRQTAAEVADKSVSEIKHFLGKTGAVHYRSGGYENGTARYEEDSVVATKR